MKTLDRLIIKAKKISGDDLKFSFGMIYRSDDDPDKWVARGDLWNYIPKDNPGSNFKSVWSICNSIEDAEKSLRDLAEKYPNNKDVVTIVDDMNQ